MTKDQLRMLSILLRTRRVVLTMRANKRKALSQAKKTLKIESNPALISANIM